VEQVPLGDSVPSAALSMLGRARLDELLEELLQRVGGVLDSQERLRGLLDAVVAIASDLSLDRVLEKITESASRLVDAQYVALGVIAPGTDRRLQSFITYGLSQEQRDAIGDLPTGHGLLGHIIEHPEPLRLEDLHAHPASYGFPPHHPPMNTFLGTPIRIRDKVFGNLYLTEKRGGGQFTAEDEEIVIALAAAAGVVIENARLYEEAAKRESWLSAAAEITAALLGPVEQREALQLVADRARSVAAADVALIMRRISEEELAIQVVSGPSAGGVVGRAIPVSQSLVGAAMANDSMLVIEDTGDSEQTYQEFEFPSDWPDLGPSMLIPLRTSSGVEGVLTVIWARHNAHNFHDVDPQLPVAFAEQAALAMQVARAQADQALLAVFEDRDRIGRDLHDLVIQRLFAIGLSLDNTARLAGRPEVADRLSTAVEDIDATIKDIRRSIFELSAPSDTTDLRAQLTQILAHASNGLGFAPTLELSGPVDTIVVDPIRQHLLAVLVECLSNATRHAHCTAVAVEVRAAKQVVLVVSDNGRGFDPDKVARVSGLHNLQDRAAGLGGSCVIESAVGQGTKIHWSVPATAE